LRIIEDYLFIMSGLKRDKFPMYRLPESKLQEFLDKIFGGNGGPYDYSISVSSIMVKRR
jgi:hypothetical protein